MYVLLLLLNILFSNCFRKTWICNYQLVYHFISFIVVIISTSWTCCCKTGENIKITVTWSLSLNVRSHRPCVRSSTGCKSDPELLLRLRRASTRVSDRHVAPASSEPGPTRPDECRTIGTDQRWNRHEYLITFYIIICSMLLLRVGAGAMAIPIVKYPYMCDFGYTSLLHS